MCGGNFPNQETAFKGQVIDSINLILFNTVGNDLIWHIKFEVMEMKQLLEQFSKQFSVRNVHFECQLLLYLQVMKQLRPLQCSCIELLEVLLEEIKEESSELARGIQAELDVDILIIVMKLLDVSKLKM